MNNRLMKTEEYDEEESLVETVTYSYEVGGSAKQLVRKS